VALRIASWCAVYVVDYLASSIRWVVFHKVVWKHCSGEVDEFQIFWCEISQDFVHQKLLKSVHFLPSYSKYKKGCFTGDTVYITTNILSLFNSLNDSFKYSKNEMNNEHRNRVTRVTENKFQPTLICWTSW